MVTMGHLTLKKGKKGCIWALEVNVCQKTALAGAELDHQVGEAEGRSLLLPEELCRVHAQEDLSIYDIEKCLRYSITKISNCFAYF